MIRIFVKGISARSVNFGAFQKVFDDYKLSLTVTRNCYPKAFFHSSCCQLSEVPSENASVGDIQKYTKTTKKKSDTPVDWLPFSWNWPPRFNPFETSGDLVKSLEYDPSWPKPDFELSEELKTASDDIKHMYSLATASKGEIKEAIKRRWLEKIQRHPNDFDSQEVNIALRTLQLRSLFEHSWKFRKEIRNGRRILDIIIKKRNKHLKLLYKLDIDRFNWLCKELKLEYKPPVLGGVRERFTKKWDLRRLTKEYCAKMIQEKKNAYHEELKKQQADFLKEKEETLAWIEKEEKEIARISKELESLAV